jgi:Mn-containing catalase
MKEVFALRGVPARAKPCKGMAGLIEEGEEIIEESEETEPAAADLALIAAAQTVGLPEVASLLSASLAEEEVSDALLTQIARELMSQARSGATKAP